MVALGAGMMDISQHSKIVVGCRSSSTLEKNRESTTE